MSDDHGPLNLNVAAGPYGQCPLSRHKHRPAGDDERRGVRARRRVRGAGPLDGGGGHHADGDGGPPGAGGGGITGVPDGSHVV